MITVLYCRLFRGGELQSDNSSIVNQKENIFERVENYGKNYCTSIPASPSDIKIKMDTKLAALLSNAHRLLGQPEGMSGFLSNGNAVNTIISYKEAQLSC